MTGFACLRAPTASCSRRQTSGGNHLFMKGGGKATPAEYDRPGYVDARVIEDIVMWIHECCRAATRHPS